MLENLLPFSEHNSTVRLAGWEGMYPWYLRNGTSWPNVFLSSLGAFEEYVGQVKIPNVLSC